MSGRAFFALVLALGVIVFANLLGPSGSSPPDEPPQATLPEADSLYRMLGRFQSTGAHEEALRLAIRLTETDFYAGSAYADSASALLTSLRDSVAARYAVAAAELARSKWSYPVSTDQMTSGTVRLASIRSENTVSFEFPYDGPQQGTLTLRTHPTYGRDVYFQIERGQVLCNSYDGCTVRVRFDEGQAQTWEAASPSDGSTELVFLRNYEGFLQRLRASDRIRIQPEIYDEGAPVFEFDVSGFVYERYAP